MKWTKNALPQSVNDLNCIVPFSDNRPAQETDDFENVVAGLNDVI